MDQCFLLVGVRPSVEAEFHTQDFLTLYIRIERSSSAPISKQIAEQIRSQCLSGVLKPKQCLPSVRQLARELAVNVNTIVRVYERLASEGLARDASWGGYICASTFERFTQYQRVGSTAFAIAMRIGCRCQTRGIARSDDRSAAEHADQSGIGCENTDSKAKIGGGIR